MIGRADIKGSKSNVAMNACTATQVRVSLWGMGKLDRDQKRGYQDAPLKKYIEN